MSLELPPIWALIVVTSSLIAKEAYYVALPFDMSWGVAPLGFFLTLGVILNFFLINVGYLFL